MNRIAAWRLGAPALLALVQMSAPVPVAATRLAVPVCGSAAGRKVPIPLRDTGDGAGCGKICHSAMRKRIGVDSSRDGEDDADAA
jgi:hypothetical protein